MGFYRAGFIKYPNLFRVIHFFNLFSLTFMAFGELNFIAKNYQNILLATQASAPIFTMVALYSKIVFIYKSRFSLYQFYDGLKALTIEAKILNPEIINKIAKIDQLSALCYMFATIVAALPYVFAPAISNLMNFIYATGEFNYELPIKSLYPFNISQSLIYELTYGLQVYGTFLAVVVGVRTQNITNDLHIL